VLAAGIVAGAVLSRVRNPRAALLLAAGTLAWRAIKPKQWPAPLLSLPRERMREEPVTVIQPEAPVIEVTTSDEPTPATVAPVEPVVVVVAKEPVFEIAEPVVAAAEPEPEAVTRLNEDAMALPPVLNLLAIEEDFKALSEGLQSPAGDDAWILGLEPMPVVEELPAPIAFTEAVLAAPLVHEHRPMIAEGAPLPDMIEISLEPAPEGLQMAMAPSPLEPRPPVVNEGPIAHSAVEPVVAAHAMPEEAPLIAPASIQTGALELFGGFLAAASVDHLVASVPPVTASMPAPAVPEPVKQPREWASFEVQPPPPEVKDEPLTLRPMPRTASNVSGGATMVSPKRNVVFGLPLPQASLAKAAEEEPAPEPEQPRRIVPHAPASTSAEDPQKSWLTWWK